MGVALATPPGGVIDRLVEADVYVGVDQARHERAAGQLHDLGAGDLWSAAAGTDVRDPGTVDEHLAVRESLAWPAGQHLIGTQQPHNPAVAHPVTRINVPPGNATSFYNQPATSCALAGGRRRCRGSSRGRAAGG